MKDEILLHIGAHKTGTTTIQHALTANREVLAARGVAYVTYGVLPNLHGALGFVRDDRKFAPEGFAARHLGPLVEALAAPAEPRVIASSENFSFFIDPARVSELAEALKKHARRVRILTYLRRQDSHIVSHHQEGAKANRRVEEMIFGYDTTSIPAHAPHAELYLDYNRRVGHWIDAFGAENVMVRVFDRAKLIGGDVWADFLDAVGLDPAGLAEIHDQNVSLGLTQAKVGHLMNARALRPELRKRVLDALPHDGRQLPSRAQAEAFYARYREGNIALARRLGLGAGDLFSDDFSAYPEAAREDWTEEEANRAIGVLLDTLGALTADLGADELRDAAIMAERAGRVDLALALMRTAAVLRQSGPLIKLKLAEYEAALPKFPKP